MDREDYFSWNDGDVEWEDEVYNTFGKPKDMTGPKPVRHEEKRNDK